MIRFCVGVTAIAFMPWLPSISIALIGIACIALLLTVLVVFVRFGLKPSSNPPDYSLVSFVYGRIKKISRLVPIILGVIWAAGYGVWGLEHRLANELEGKDLRLQGIITGLPQRNADQCRFTLLVDDEFPIETVQPTTSQPTSDPFNRFFSLRKINLNWYQCDQALQPGQKMTLVTRLKQPYGYRNPGGFDRERQLFSQGIDALGYVRSATFGPQPDAWMLLLSGNVLPMIDLWRSRLSGFIESKITDVESSAVLRALIIGDKRGLSQDQWQLFRETGTIHLLVISGLHIGLVTGGVFFVAYGMGRLFPHVRLIHRQRSGVVLALIAGLAYAAFAGFSLPTQRAWIMAAVVLITSVSSHQVDVSRRCALAAALVLLIDPLAIFNIGFWLSFGAVCTLLYVLCGRLSSPSWWLQLIKIQWSMLLLSVPLLGFAFYQVPVTSPISNLFAVPLVSFIILPLALTSMLMIGISDVVGSVGLEWSSRLIEMGSCWLHWGNQKIGQLWFPENTSFVTLTLALLGVLVILAPKGLPLRWLGVLLWLPLVAGAGNGLLEEEFRVTVIDVGQGLSVLVETKNHRLLYDAAASYPSGFTVAKTTVLPMLQSKGIRHLDTMIISHADNDHAGGEEFLYNNLVIDEVVTGSKSPVIGSTQCQAGDSWLWDGVVFKIIHPLEKLSAEENNRSCVLLISSTNGSALLTGDILEFVERRLMKKKELAGIDLLLVPHHGSKTSSSEEFLTNLRPRYAVVSSGYRNRFGHPHAKVVARYSKRDIQLLNTTDQGAIAVTFSQGNSMAVEAYSKVARRYWWNLR